MKSVNTRFDFKFSFWLSLWVWDCHAKTKLNALNVLLDKNSDIVCNIMGVMWTCGVYREDVLIVNGSN